MHASEHERRVRLGSINVELGPRKRLRLLGVEEKVAEGGVDEGGKIWGGVYVVLQECKKAGSIFNQNRKSSGGPQHRHDGYAGK